MNIKKQETELKNLKAEFGKLDIELKNKSAWIEENLDSKDNFDLGCIYTIITASGNLTSIIVQSTAIYFTNGTTQYSTSSSNRKAVSIGWAVTKLLKCKL